MNEHATPPAQDDPLRGTGRTLRTILRVLASEEPETALLCKRAGEATMLCTFAWEIASKLRIPAKRKTNASFTIDGRVIRFLRFDDAAKYGGITVAYADHDPTPRRVPLFARTRPMTPREAHDRFSECVNEIMASGVEIRGLDVSAVEFHPAGTPPRRHDGPYACGRLTPSLDAEPRWIITHIDEEKPIGMLHDGEAAKRITHTLNSAHRTLRRIKATLAEIDREPPGPAQEQASLESFERAVYGDLEPLQKLTPTGPTPVGSATHTGDVCAKCGSDQLTWSGTCKTCRECGDAGGCG